MQEQCQTETKPYVRYLAYLTNQNGRVSAVFEACCPADRGGHHDNLPKAPRGPIAYRPAIVSSSRLLDLTVVATHHQAAARVPGVFARGPEILRHGGSSDDFAAEERNLPRRRIASARPAACGQAPVRVIR